MYSFSTRVFLRILPGVLEPLYVTIMVCLVGGFFALILGTLLAMGRRSRFKPIALPCAAYIAFIRATPLLVQIFFLFYGGHRLGIVFSALTTGIIILTLHDAGYIAEIVRAGIESIDRSQYEAADSLGFTFTKKMQYVIIPQAYRAILPPLTNQMSYLIKDSSLLSVIGLTELIKFARVSQAETFRPVESFIPSILSYLALILGILYASKALENRWRKRGGTKHG
jgi:His/Glu/Gln/Arg/opine family amino acid ABC transporter permease subunit